MHWLFAYGSNMHLNDLKRWFSTSNLPPGRIVQARSGKLAGYRLVWNYHAPVRGGGAANIEPAADELDELPGVLLQVDQVALDGIDQKEGHPHRYRRRAVEPQLSTGEKLRAFTYIAEGAQVVPHFVPPTRHYLNLLIEGARAFSLPEQHIRALMALRTVD